MKTCIKCGIKKDETEFYKGRNKCKECFKEYRQKNKEYKKEYNKEYRQKNKERIKEAKKEYRQKNKECIKEYQKEYYQKNKERIKENIKEYDKEYVEQCTDGYIRRLLARDSTLNSSDIPQGLIESKRLLIQIERYIKKQTT